MSDTAEITALVDDFFTVFRLQMEIAGRYALTLQQQLKTIALAKSGDAWTSALTDADLGVQAYLEAWVLAERPHWHLWGEEYERSGNTDYFDPDADVAVYLDPINGTRLYRDGGHTFDVLASITLRGRLLATLSHMPAQAVTLAASLERPTAWFDTGATAPRPWVAPAPADTLAIYEADALRASLPQDLPVFHMLEDYRPDDLRCCLNSVFTGALGGYLFCGCPMLDVGATAFAVQQSGGVATQPDGSALEDFASFDPRTPRDLLVAMEPALHERIVTALAATPA